MSHESIEKKIFPLTNPAKIHLKDKKHKKSFCKIEAAAVNILDHIGTDLSREIIRHFSIAALIYFREVNQKTKKLADEALNQRFGCRPAAYITNLKKEFQLALKNKCLPKKLYFRRKKPLSFVQVLNNFHYASNAEKISLFVKVEFLSDSYKLIRNLIQSIGLSREFKANPIIMDKIVRLHEENLLQFAIDGFYYPHLISAPLHYAAQQANIKALEYLIKNAPTSINNRGIYGATALCFACGCCPRFDYPLSERLRAKAVKLLLESGADPSLGCTSSYLSRHTPLYFAIITKRENLVKLLLNFGVDPHIEINPNFSPFSLAKARKEESPAIWDLLKAYNF